MIIAFKYKRLLNLCLSNPELLGKEIQFLNLFFLTLAGFARLKSIDKIMTNSFLNNLFSHTLRAAMTSLDKRVTNFPENAVNNIFFKLVTGSETPDSNQIKSSESNSPSEYFSQWRSRSPSLSLKIYLSVSYDLIINFKKFMCWAGSLWQNYNAILTKDQAGLTILAQKSGSEHTLMAIKEIKTTQEKCVKRF